MLKLDIQIFADGKVVIDTELNAKNFENGLDKIKGTTQKAGSTIKSIVVGLGITKLISTAMNTITGSIDSAIDRIDTLNNFPKVMSNLGISAEESQKAISKMSDKLAGLPTTLDDGARAVQRFTSKNGNVKKSTDLFLALNNAILAGGASSEIQASALEQLSQAYAKGKPDMMEWRTAMTAMPAQLKQVAEAMGYIDADQLGEALRNGTVSMDEFMDTITKLNKEGVNGLQSFEKQARNSTSGIGTSIQVAKTQVVKGVTDIIDALNTKTENLGIGSLSDIIAKMGEETKKGLDEIAKLISGETTVEEFTNAAGDLITQFVQKINEKLPTIINSGVEFMTTFISAAADQIPKLLPELVETLITTFMTITSDENLDKIGKAGADLIIKLCEGIIKSIPLLIENSEFTFKAFTNVLSGGQKLLAKLGFSLIKSLIKGFIDAIPDLAESAFKIIKTFIDKITTTIPNLINKGKEVAQKFANGIRDGGLGYIKDVGSQLVNGLWNGIKSKWESLKSKVSGLANEVIGRFKSVFGIHSPSRVFRDEIGSMLAEGLGVGFNDTIKDVYSEMQKAIDFETSKMEANVQSSGTYQMAMAGTPVFNLQDNSTDRIVLVADGRSLAEVVNTHNRNREVAKA